MQRNWLYCQRQRLQGAPSAHGHTLSETHARPQRPLACQLLEVIAGASPGARQAGLLEGGYSCCCCCCVRPSGLHSQARSAAGAAAPKDQGEGIPLPTRPPPRHPDPPMVLIQMLMAPRRWRLTARQLLLGWLHPGLPAAGPLPAEPDVPTGGSEGSLQHRNRVQIQGAHCRGWCTRAGVRCLARGAARVRSLARMARISPWAASAGVNTRA